MPATATPRYEPDENLLIQLAHRYPEFTRLRRELEESASLGPLPRIAVCGLMNAGKSALLNGMTGSLENELFETKAVRATTRVQELEHEGRLYLDTPGIDVCDEDDQQAWLGLANADVILFVHNLRTGTLEDIEITFLRELMRRRPDLEQHLLVVLTHAESATQQQTREQSIRNILQSLFEVVPPLFATSFNTLRNGVQKRKSKLVELSGYSRLNDHLDTQLHLSAESLRDQRIDRNKHRYIELERFLNQQIAERKEHLLRIEETQSSTLDQLKRSVQSLFASITQGLARCQAD